jgi:hypothetical protein
MFDLDGATSFEGVEVAIGRETKRIPVAKWSLHAELGLEGPERRVCVVGPITPS